MIEDIINFYTFVGFNVGWLCGMIISRIAVKNQTHNY